MRKAISISVLAALLSIQSQGVLAGTNPFKAIFQKTGMSEVAENWHKRRDTKAQIQGVADEMMSEYYVSAFLEATSSMAYIQLKATYSSRPMELLWMEVALKNASEEAKKKIPDLARSMNKDLKDRLKDHFSAEEINQIHENLTATMYSKIVMDLTRGITAAAIACVMTPLSAEKIEEILSQNKSAVDALSDKRLDEKDKRIWAHLILDITKKYQLEQLEAYRSVVKQDVMVKFSKSVKDVSELLAARHQKIFKDAMH